MLQQITSIFEFLKEQFTKSEDKDLVLFLNRLQSIKEDLVSGNTRVIESALQRLDDFLLEAMGDYFDTLYDVIEINGLKRQLKELRSKANSIDSTYSDAEINGLLRAILSFEANFDTSRKPSKKQPVLMKFFMFSVPLVLGYFISSYMETENKLELTNVEITNPSDVFKIDDDRITFKEDYENDLRKTLNRTFFSGSVLSENSLGNLISKDVTMGDVIFWSASENGGNDSIMIKSTFRNRTKNFPIAVSSVATTVRKSEERVKYDWHSLNTNPEIVIDDKDFGYFKIATNNDRPILDFELLISKNDQEIYANYTKEVYYSEEAIVYLRNWLALTLDSEESLIAPKYYLLSDSSAFGRATDMNNGYHYMRINTKNDLLSIIPSALSDSLKVRWRGYSLEDSVFQNQYFVQIPENEIYYHEEEPLYDQPYDLDEYRKILTAPEILSEVMSPSLEGLDALYTLLGNDPIEADSAVKVINRTLKFSLKSLAHGGRISQFQEVNQLLAGEGVVFFRNHFAGYRNGNYKIKLVINGEPVKEYFLNCPIPSHLSYSYYETTAAFGYNQKTSGIDLNDDFNK